MSAPLFATGLQLAFTEPFLRDQRRFASEREVVAELASALAEIASQPFHNPKLETHRVQGGQRGLLTSYVGNLQHRVIWFRGGATAVLLAFDRHDEACRRARRLRVNYDEQGGAVRVGEEATPRAPAWRHRSRAVVRGPRPRAYAAGRGSVSAPATCVTSADSSWPC